ncbi:type VI lipase adapter Tla3 domain-containing protein [Trinickia sp.]|uniref:type VI lipase adapter Tla3 domain-containing protein n=1 Tax=Trinickia sp. TaxID=2571163 RepID=UPI003F7ECF94
MYGNYQHWQTTGLIEPMGNKIRNGVLAVGALLALTYAAVWGGSLFGHTAGNGAEGSRSASARAIVNQPAAAPAMLSASGARYVLEVRSLGMVVSRDADDEIWEKLVQKADNFSSILSQNASDYADSADRRMSRYTQVSGLAFQEAAGHTVEYWPIPTIIWGPPRDPKNSYRAAVDISANRQEAGLGVNLFLWADDANTADGAAVIARLFDFFDKHPDVPAALIFCEDSDVARSLFGPDSLGLPNGTAVPTVPDSIVGMLVSRSDRVDKLIRPFAVDQSAAINKDTTQYDVTRLWNYYWAKSDDRGPDSFRVSYINEMKHQGYDDPSPVNTMTAGWWQQQLQAFWSQIGNKGPGDFKPTPYLPVRWTTWQVEQFDNMPLIGYLHRPVDVKLTSDDGKLLPKSEQIVALKNGWASALGTLEPTTEPKRVFYDTTGDRQWAIPITQALSQEGAKAPDISDVKQGYDIGRRIGNTGVSSPMVQLGLGLIASYKEGGASATINRRPDGNATIMMVSPPEAATKAAWLQQHGGHDPF